MTEKTGGSHWRGLQGIGQNRNLVEWTSENQNADRGSRLTAIKIVATPPGEAPQHIREAWVGLTLPLAVPFLRSGWIIGGVLTRPRTYLSYQLQRLIGRGRREIGYLVNVETAITLLERVHPSAADWWRQNTPELLAPNRNFLFSAEACEETEAVVWPPPPESQSVSQGTGI